MLRALNASESATLCRFLDRLIPEDDYPGAVGAGVPEFLGRLASSDLPGLVLELRQGLAGLEAEAQAGYRMGFSQLDDAQADIIIARSEQGEVRTPWDMDPKAFIGHLVTLTAEGYYADPGAGANRGAASWRMLGFERGHS